MVFLFLFFEIFCCFVPLYKIMGMFWFKFWMKNILVDLCLGICEALSINCLSKFIYLGLSNSGLMPCG